jgi:hypothetical protein
MAVAPQDPKNQATGYPVNCHYGQAYRNTACQNFVVFV